MLADLPAMVKHDYSAHMNEEDESIDVDDHEEAAPVVNAPLERRAPARNGEEVILKELCARARSAHERLRALLTGRIVISLRDLGRSFAFNWTSAQASVEEVPAAKAKELMAHAKSSDTQLAPAEDSAAASLKDEIDCYITLSDRDVYRIYRGDLNPQIAMLSDKIEVGGKLSFAVYFFNLIAPRVS